MAKSVRASSKKKAKAIKRETPRYKQVEEARLLRLAAAQAACALAPPVPIAKKETQDETKESTDGMQVDSPVGGQSKKAKNYKAKKKGVLKNKKSKLIRLR